MADDFKYHIDHAGSLVRPPALIEARQARAAGRAGDAEVRAAEDEAVAEAARLQRRIGLSAIGDGEYRRDDTTSVVYDAVKGFGGTAATPLAELFAEIASLPPGPAAVAKLEPAGRLAAHEASFLRSATRRSTVVTLPSAAFVTERSFDADRSSAAYASPGLLGAELARVIREEVQALAGDGIDHVRLANPAYALVLASAGRERLRAAGADPDELLDRMTDTDAASIVALDVGEDFRVSLDLTTGGAPVLADGYDATAVTRFFERLAVGRIHVEYPEAVNSRFPLELVPAGRVIALGVVDVGSASPESVEDLLDRIDTASSVLDLEDIAISTNGGFAPAAGAPGRVSWAGQHARLELVETAARYYWGNEL
ncbi:hypothetical protein [Actinomadura sp. DC4]|uniref:hypothetical protein n=1 Tax=Actinomadura sp. DC4 TaxID=3055069 RepID=UPI0025B02810|nr:hypothetical protein [Actinomadura sp. DC4]MDN3359072.1 hypothetical protein [Actinomadura sp. DC4]